MEDDWDDGAISCSTTQTGLVSEGGTKFAAGRGFKAAESGDWDVDTFEQVSPGFNNKRDVRKPGRGAGYYKNKDNNENEDWTFTTDESGDFQHKSEPFGGGRGGRGRAGRGNRGGRGGRGNGGHRHDEKENGWSNHKNGANHQGARSEDASGDAPKPKDNYVPVERINDDELFTNTISSGVNFMKLDEIIVDVKGHDVPQPISSFESTELRPHILNNISKSGYTRPTPIQKYGIPIVLAGRDLMGCAQTGSGKTAAFLLPMINKIMATQDPPIKDGNTCQPLGVVVSPTRELAIQIYEQARKFAHNSIVKCAVVYGGTSVSYQRSMVLGGCHILVATPGRLNDFVNRGHVSFASVQMFVLDEADRMLDMGFLATVQQMLEHSTMIETGKRQTLMFSATFPESIQHLAAQFLNDYVFVAVGIVGGASNDVEQVFHLVARFDKRPKLVEMLKNTNERTVVFVETKRNADFLATFLSENDIKSTSIHGDRLQREREQALWDFKQGRRNILVATDVAARGLDIDGIQHVINYDLPKSIDEYVHRIGRTGRVGNRGKATSFYDASKDQNLAGSLATVLRQAGQPVPDFLDVAASGDVAESSMFGGRDVRGDQFGKGQNYSQVPAEIQDDDW
ncbi:hypothetical protein GWI33_013214 [Rhynchophorus ferrugineus]|uniref:RNA helicase n=1 Tax=Rhynchophorus ferrugineus TaxID=354439 RepID=A0A834MA59_RHYFE|nr:hypothetical protein GWI33_013214 [Rhynchophorus ferrugineus]